MKAVFSQGVLFRRVIESFKDFVTEGNFICEPDAITLQAMDTAHVALVSLCLTGFESYTCPTGFSMGVQLNPLYRALKCMDPEDQLTLDADYKEDTLGIEINRDVRSARFQLHLIDLDTDRLSIPEQEYEVNLTMTAVEFKKICTDLSHFGETITLGGMDDGFVFTVTGDSGEASINLKTPIEYSCYSEVFLNFPLRHLIGFTKATPLAEQVHLRLSVDSPLVVEYAFPEGWIKFYLSPKINDD